MRRPTPPAAPAERREHARPGRSGRPPEPFEPDPEYWLRGWEKPSELPPAPAAATAREHHEPLVRYPAGAPSAYHQAAPQAPHQAVPQATQAAHPRAGRTAERIVVRGEPPEPVGSGGRLLFALLFWFGVATSLELWWLDTPAETMTTTGDLLTAAGRITGLLAGYALLVQILLTSRVRWLERWMGAHDLLAWHRDMGAFLFVTVLGHMTLTLLGYASLSEEPVTGQAWTMLTTYEDMLAAFGATGLVVVVGLLAARTIRRAMPYELWRWLHLTSYLVVLLGYAHEFTYGQELAHGFGRWYWIGLHVFVLACVAWGRVVTPLSLNLRHRFRVAHVAPEAPDTVSIYIEGRRLDRLQVRAGQFFRWRFLARGCWWQAHPFSLSAAPNGRWLRVTVKAVGEYTRNLQQLDGPVRVFAHGPAGAFTAERRTCPRALLIAAGSGIAPVRALLEELPAGTVIVYRARNAADLVFRPELDRLAEDRRGKVWYVVGRRDDPGPRHLFTPRGLRELVPDVAERDAYLCGPPGLIAAATATLRRLGVRKRQIHLDPFEF